MPFEVKNVCIDHSIPDTAPKKKGDTYDHTIFHGTSLAGTISALPSFILTPLRD